MLLGTIAVFFAWLLVRRKLPLNLEFTPWGYLLAIVIGVSIGVLIPDFFGIVTFLSSLSSGLLINVFQISRFHRSRKLLNPK